jgi:hypothetical protein
VQVKKTLSGVVLWRSGQVVCTYMHMCMYRARKSGDGDGDVNRKMSIVVSDGIVSSLKVRKLQKKV